MTTGSRILVVAILLLPTGYADAQTPPWPADAGAIQSAPRSSVPVKPWPNAAPQVVPPMAGMPSACTAEFTKLRDAAVEKGTAAKAAAQQHVARKELCEYVTVYFAAETRWADFVKASVQSCSIPAKLVDQVQKAHSASERMRVTLCDDAGVPR